MALVAVVNAELRELVSSALASADAEYDLVPTTVRSAESLLGYNLGVLIADADFLVGLAESDRSILRHVGVEILLAFRSGNCQKLPLELGVGISDFIELPSPVNVVRDRVKRALEIYRLRGHLTDAPRAPGEAKAISERLRKVPSSSGPQSDPNPERSRRGGDLERLKSNLITIISHEFKTPLHLAAGYIELMEDGSLGTLTEDQSKAVQTVKKQLARLSEKLSDIERIAHLEMGLSAELRDPVDLRLLLENEITGFEEGLRRKSITVELKTDRHLPNVMGSQDFLADVFRRLIDNAIHYNRPNGTITIEAHVERKDSEALVVTRVVDTGSGIPPAMLPHIFDRFGEFRDIEHHSSRRSGLGLGLAIVRHLVEIHDGTIAVESKVGEGSAFIVRLPAGK
jgi:signal transduction histidine kinase